jgi:CRISPR-associated endonuclease Csn1
VRYNKQGEAISFVKPGNNHHVAIYVDERGNWQEHIATFWHAVERKKYGVPTIITNPGEVWENVSGIYTRVILETTAGVCYLAVRVLYAAE